MENAYEANNGPTTSGRVRTLIYIAVLIVLSLWMAPEQPGTLAWYNLVMPSITMLFVAACVMTAIVLIFVKLVGGVSGFGLSIGMLANMPVAQFRTFGLYVGLLPVADTILPLTILNRKGAYWSVTALPSILMIAIGCVIMGICQSSAAELTAISPFFNISYCSLLALFSQSCIINGVTYELTHIDRLKDVFPQSGCAYTISELIILSAFFYLSPILLSFCKEFVFGITPIN